jgi:hypothetical protein
MSCCPRMNHQCTQLDHTCTTKIQDEESGDDWCLMYHYYFANNFITISCVV